MREIYIYIFFFLIFFLTLLLVSVMQDDDLADGGVTSDGIGFFFLLFLF